jgi:hypothetical protein
VKLIFNVNVVLDVCATDGATPTPSHAGRRSAGSAFPIRFRGHENPDDGVGAARAFLGKIGSDTGDLGMGWTQFPLERTK